MKYLKDKKKLRKTLAMPFIWGMLMSLILLHFSVEIYHQIAFRLYDLKLVSWKQYVRIDRHKLSKLSFMQKVYCVYCGYANGLLPYATAIAAETEKYWCGIKHNTNDNVNFIEPAHHQSFIDYNKYK